MKFLRFLICSCSIFLSACKKESESLGVDVAKGVMPPKGKVSIHQQVSRLSKDGFGGYRNVLGGASPDPKRVSGIFEALEKLTDIQLVEILSSLDVVSSDADREMAKCAISVLSMKNPRRALDAIANLPANSKIISIGIYYDMMVKKDPDVVLEWLANNCESSSNNVKVAAVQMIRHLSICKSADTVKLLAKMGPGLRGYLLPMVMKGVVDTDPDMALKLAHENLKGDDLSAGMVSIISNVSKTNMEKAILFLDSISGEASSKCIREILLAMAEQKQGDVASLIKRIPPGELSEAIEGGGVIERLATQNPEQAKEIVTNIPFTEANKGIYTRLAVALAEGEAGQAIEFISNLPSSSSSKELLGKVFEAMARKDPDTAIASVVTLDADQQPMALRGLVKELASSDYSRSLDLAAKSAPAFQQDMYREIARAVTYSNPDQAVGILEDPTMGAKLGDGFRSEMLNHTVQTWATQDCDAAQAWVEKLPEQDLPKGVQGLMASWMKTDPVAASAWLAKLPPGPARDAGALQIIQQVKNTDPEMAEQWRKSLTPPPSK